MSGRGQATGRAAQVREFLQRRPGPYSARELLEAIEPGGRADCMSATCACMVKTGALERVGSGHGNVRFRLATAPRAKVPRAPSNVSPPTREAPRRFASPKVEREAAQARTRSKVSHAHKVRAREISAKAIGGLARAAPGVTRKSPTTNFTAAPGTVEHLTDPRRRASAQIAADLAAFQARGGRIEQLGVTRIFHQLDD